MKLSNIIKRDWPVLLMILLPFLFMVVYWNNIPEKLPVHWNVEGEIDDWMDKPWGVLLLPLVNLGIYFLLLFLPYIDPKKNIQYFIGTLQKVKYILHGFILLLFIYTIYSAMNPHAAGEKLIPLLALGLIMVLGNYMGKMKPNYFIGVRTPWTLHSDEIWLKTHILTGRIWTGGSMLMLIIWLLLPVKTFTVLIIPFIIIIALIPILYSYFLFKKGT